VGDVPHEGDPAPEIECADESGTVRRLSEQRGRYAVVYFYPKDLTSGCTAEACSFRDASADLAADGAVVWGISPQDAGSHQRFRERHALSFPLLVDDAHRVAEAYGVWVEKSLYGRRYWANARTTFLIGPDGRIARVWEKVRPEGHGQEVLAALRELNRE
jgi:thioredoxin-dependent peroxiredoxin